MGIINCCKVVYHDKELQNKMDALAARMKSPEYIAQRRAELREERQLFWKPFLIAMFVIASAMSAAAIVFLPPISGNYELALAVCGALIGMPVLLLAFSYPRN